MTQPISSPRDDNRDLRRRSLVLASSSRYRQALLERLSIPFETRVPNIDEYAFESESPAQLVERLSEQKARALAKDFPRHLIIGGDQVAVYDDDIIGKPHTRPVAIEQLRRFRGREIEFLTGVCVLDTTNGSVFSEIVTVRVQFRSLSDEQIEHYVDIDTPFDCAGSFKCERLGIALFERIDSADPSALTGLPLIALTRLLHQHGFDVLARLTNL